MLALAVAVALAAPAGPAPARPAARAEPARTHLVGLGLACGSAAALVAGTATAGVALVLGGDATGAKSELERQTKEFGGDTVALAAAHDAYLAKRATWNDTGIELAWTGAGALALSAALAAGALWTWDVE